MIGNLNSSIIFLSVFILLFLTNCKKEPSKNHTNCDCPLLSENYLLLLGGTEQILIEANASQQDLDSGNKIELKGGIESNNTKAISIGGELILPVSVLGLNRRYKKIHTKSNEHTESQYKKYVEWYCSYYVALIDKSDCDGAQSGKESMFRKFEQDNLNRIDQLFKLDQETIPTTDKTNIEDTKKPGKNRVDHNRSKSDPEQLFRELIVELPIPSSEIKSVDFNPDQGIEIKSQGLSILELWVHVELDFQITLLSQSGEKYIATVREQDATILKSNFKKL